MKITDFYYNFVRATQSISRLSIQPELYAIAEAAYQYNIRLFGPPKDASWKFEVVTAPNASMARDPIRRIYILTVREYDAQPEHRLASVAHEVYHRVTSRRKGLHKYLWVDEMLAFLSTHHFLRDYGMNEYTEGYLQECYSQHKRLDIYTIKKVKRRPLFLSLFKSHYPPKYSSSIAVLATTIETVVGWESMCKLVQCQTWNDWFEVIPERSREHIRGIIKE